MAKYIRLHKKNCIYFNEQLIKLNLPICSVLGQLIGKRGIRQFSSSNDDDSNLKSNRIPADIDSLDLAYDYDRHTKEIINIDSNNWKNVPSSLDLSSMKTFPLFPVKCNDNFNEMKSIGIFEDGYKKIPSVRNILKETMSDNDRKILDNWEKRMIREMGVEKFEKHKKGLLSRGDIFHQCIELYLKGVEPSSEQLVGIEDLWYSVKHVLKQLSNVILLESRIIHPHLHYQGVVDCVACYRERMMAIEFKTSNKPKLTLSAARDDPLQVVAYLGALMFDAAFGHPRMDGVMLVYAYPTGLPAHVHRLHEKESNNYWEIWRKRLIQFWRMQQIQ